MSSLPVIYCFAGQGSQYFGMAAGLLAADAVFAHWMRTGDAIVAARHGFSVLDEIYGHGRSVTQPFDCLEVSHPALFLVQYALAKSLQQRGLRPDMLLGVSLGELVAQTVAGMLEFETALTAVADQPGQFRRTCDAGGMVAVLAPSSLHASNPQLAARSEIAGITSPSHFILSAQAADLSAIEAELRRLNVVFQRLPVPFAFHSSFIEPACASVRKATASLRREGAFWPVWSCCLASTTGPAADDLLWRIVRDPMQVERTLAAIEARGGGVYVDLSPSGTLSTVFRHALPATSPSRVISVLSPFGDDNNRLSHAAATLGHLVGDTSFG